MEIKDQDYRVWYEADTATIFFQGFLGLDGSEAYKPVLNEMLEVVGTLAKVVLDLQELEFLNSSGISMLSTFVVSMRKRGDIELSLKGSEKILWQTRSLKNLQRLMPSLVLEFV